MRKIFSLFSLFAFATFISCDDYDAGLEAPASLSFVNANELVAYVAESNVKTLRVYATTKSNVDRVVTINQLLEGTDPSTNQPYSTAVAGDYTLSTDSVIIPAGELYGSFDVVFDPALSLAATRYVTLSIDSPGDEYVLNKTKNNVKVTYNRLCFSNTILFDLVLDRYGSEISWNIKDSSGAIVQSGGPYSDAATSVLQPQPQMSFTLPDGTYTFTINDFYGDGMYTSDAVNGTYKIAKDCGTILINELGNSFTTTRSHTFSLP